MLDEIDSDEDSDIIDESDDDGSDLEGFIVPDSECTDVISIPKNYREIDKEWNEWKPTSPGSLRFKNMVNDIETMAKYQTDELNF